MPLMIDYFEMMNAEISPSELKRLEKPGKDTHGVG